MALATRCPYCHTTFRVVQDQLKLFNGVVRCGTCRQIFNGAEQLLPEDVSAFEAIPEGMDVTAGQVPPLDQGHGMPVGLPQPAADLASAGQVEDFHLILSTADEDSAPSSTVFPGTPDPSLPDDDDRQRQAISLAPEVDALTALDLTPDFRREPHLAGQIQPEPDVEAHEVETSAEPTPFPEILLAKQQSQAYHENEPVLAESEPVAPKVEEPGFVKRARRQQRFGRIWRVIMLLGILVMLPLLLLQAVDVFHDRIAASFPQLTPVLEQVCEFVECPTELPRQIDQMSVEVSELQAPSGNETAYTLNLVLRNRSALAQAWPDLELTLNDNSEKAVARRVFVAGDYLANPQDVAVGFGAHSEQSIKLVFELEKIKPSGYRVYLFYP